MRLATAVLSSLILFAHVPAYSQSNGSDLGGFEAELGALMQDIAKLDGDLAKASTKVKSPKPVAPAAPAKTLRVDCNARKPDTITGALAKARDGDTIAIAGSCQETVVVEKSVTLEAQSGASLTPADPGDVTITVVASNVSISGLSLEAPAGTQIVAFQGAFVRVDSCVIRNASGVGVLASFGSRITLLSSTISDNGNGVVVMDGSQGRVGLEIRTDTVAQSNTIARNGTGVVATDSSFVIVVGNSISANGNGVVALDQSRALVAANTIAGNNFGIALNLNSNVELATPGSPNPLFGTPNSGVNATLAIVCLGGSISGQVGGFVPGASIAAPAGTLIPTGGPGPATFCRDSTVP